MQGRRKGLLKHAISRPCIQASGSSFLSLPMKLGRCNGMTIQLV